MDQRVNKLRMNVMNEEKLKNKVISATKWSTITEVAAKFVAPVTNMVLARILTPEAFGVVATVTMITSFADMFTDAGFQKYLIQREFKDDEEKFKSTNVAFLTNFFVSILLWCIIILFNEEIARLVGNPGLGHVIVVACIQLPLTAFSSIQTALFKRDFDFKTLFIVRIAAILVPVIVTIPLALLGLGYWALIIGTLFMQLTKAVILTAKSPWKPNLFFSWSVLKNMLSFSIWTLVESISIWLTSWVDMFIISKFLDEYYLGIYRTSITMVNSLMGVVTAAILPVLFSTLSRLQNNEPAYRNMFYRYQRIVAYLVFPMGTGIFLYSDLATDIMLGEQWTEASKIIGIWSLTSVLLIPTSHFNSEVYRSKGRPKLSFLSQIIHLSFLIPTCLLSGQYGFWPLVYARALIRLQGFVTGFVIMKIVIKFPVLKTLRNLSKPFMFTIVMALFSIFLKSFSDSSIWYFVAIMFSAIFYFLLVFLFSKKDVELAKKFLVKER